VAWGPKESDEGVVDGAGEVGRDGGEVGFQRIEDEGLNLVHGVEARAVKALDVATGFDDVLAVS
jgi:hypothetical protein